LPAATIQLQDERNRPILFRQGRHQQVKARQKQGLLAELVPFLSRLLLLTQGLGLFVGEDDGDQADAQALSLTDVVN